MTGARPNIRIRNRATKEIKRKFLLADQLNWHTHPDEQRAALAAAFAEIGFVGHVLVRPAEQKNRWYLIDGHERVEHFAADELVPCCILDVDESEARKLLLSYDPLGYLGGVDAEQLRELTEEVQFDDAQLSRIIADGLRTISGDAADEPPADVAEDTPPSADEAAKLEKKWKTKRGQLWEITGPSGMVHRLLCGDSTKADDVEQVMGGEKADLLLTDPPYGIGIVGPSGTAGNFPGTSAPRLKSTPIEGDDKPFDPAHLMSAATKIILWGGNHYAERLPSESKWLVWDKKDGAFRESDLGDCEMAWTNLGGAARLLHHTWQGMYRKGAGERSARIHPTQKPVDLMAWCMTQAKLGEGAVVLDLYIGSGTTMVAAEQLNRRCFGVEISPAYCAVILERMVNLGCDCILISDQPSAQNAES